jgi:hypothetical protein
MSESRPIGRPTSYQLEYAEQATKLCLLGATDDEIADFFGVHRATIYRWKLDHQDFCDAIKAAKDVADERVERSLYQMATGFDFTEEQAIKVKVDQYKEHVEVVEVRKHMPAQTPAAIFWLKNRRRGEWRDKQDLEHSGPDGGPIQTESTVLDAASMTPEERATMRAILEAAQARKMEVK